jgi:hypothetical protein
MNGDPTPREQPSSPRGEASMRREPGKGRVCAAAATTADGAFPQVRGGNPKYHNSHISLKGKGLPHQT